ncbi:MAG: HupE/UreJ family protein [Steroidobacteraceae bacterium]
MSRTRILALAASCLLVGAAHVALAAGDSVSYSTWVVSRDSGTVTLRYVLPVDTAQGLTGAAIPVLTVSKLGDYVLAHTDVWARGHECPASDQGYDLGKVDPLEVGTGLYGFEIIFRCAGPMSGLSLHDYAMFERAPAHVDFARIEIDGRFTRQLFTASSQRLAVPDTGSLPAAGIGEYVRLGLMHILHGSARLCFLLAALLLVRRWQDVASILATLAAGYGLALLAQATGWIQPQTALIESFIGCLVALLAVGIATVQIGRLQIAAAGWTALLLLLAVAAASMHAADAALLLLGAALFSAGFLATSAGRARPRLWLLPAGILGLLDGFVLPALLAPQHLAGWTRAPMVIGYDAGAVLADALVLALLAAGALALLRSRYFSLLRPAMSDLSAACLGGLGMFWLVSGAAQTLPPAGAGKVGISIGQALAHVGEASESSDSLLMRKYELQGNTLVARPSQPEQ